MNYKFLKANVHKDHTSYTNEKHYFLYGNQFFLTDLKHKVWFNDVVALGWIEAGFFEIIIKDTK